MESLLGLIELPACLQDDGQLVGDDAGIATMLNDLRMVRAQLARQIQSGSISADGLVGVAKHLVDEAHAPLRKGELLAEERIALVLVVKPLQETKRIAQDDLAESL